LLFQLFKLSNQYYEYK